MHSEDIEAIARNFVDLLTPGNFDKAKEWLSPSCEYHYGENILRGDAILNSFIENHERASHKLDRIEYLSSSVEKIEGLTVSVRVTDRIWVGRRAHDYQDRLVVTLEECPNPSVVRIENRRVDGEQERLMSFLKTCGIEWK